MHEHRFESREAASLAAAGQIVSALERRIAAQGNASLVVSGGTSPAQCLRALSSSELSWPDVHVVLSDERWVPADHVDSNERMIRETLLQDAAAGAILHGLYREGVTAEQRCIQFNDDFKSLPFPFACALLGMGADGHFASLFPDAANLGDGLNPDFAGLCMAVQTDASPYERVSLTLAALSRSDEIVLLIFGEDKWTTLQSAKAGPDAYPVSRLLLQKRAPVSIYWAP